MVFVPKLDWEDDPSTDTPITAAELIRIEQGVVEGTRDASEVLTGNVELASAAEMSAGSDLTRPPSVKRVYDWVNTAISTAIGALPGVASASETTAGIVELASTAEMTTGTDTGRVPSVSKVAAYVATAISGLQSGTITPPVTFTAPSAAVIPLTVKGASSQTGDLLRATDSSNAVLAAVEKNGDVRPGASASMIGMFKALCRSAATPGLSLRAASAQTASIIDIQNNAGTTIMAIGPNGVVNGQNVGTIPGSSITFAPLLVLDNMEVVPGGTPSGTVIMRRP